ncbi:RNA polymerase II-binding domain containing protein [Trema orientale]|uniref:RNA polymerase II-binding domain containing protein n=1 Tax=Trema orientale TaxID=63057 RepID=A0A2P5BVN6_TREOI|nr:RNA polymerase II-binding domain containing protein [Trema orientale]
MAPSRRKGASKAAAAAAARRQWKVGDLVLAKVKGFPAWPATVSEPEKWGYSTDWKKVLVYFFGTQQIAFCNPADVEAFTEEKKQTLLVKRHGKGADFVRAVQEIIDSYEKLKKQDQADDFNSEGVTHINGGNSVDSSANLGSKDRHEAPEATLDSRFNSSSSTADGNDPSPPVEDTSATAPVDAVGEKEEPTDTTAVTEIPLRTIFSSRKRSRNLPLQGGVPQKKEPIVRRSRTSSRLESRRLRGSIVQCNDNSKTVGNRSASVVRDGLLRRNRQRMKSADASECDDVDLSAFVSNGSIEDNGSEIVTVESDTFSFNEGSTIDSDCKIEHSETLVGCLEGDVELSKAFDLQIKAVVIKKKRKPNRKRMSNDALEPTITVDKEAGAHCTSESSQNACEKMNGSCPKEDGDEHLPLVKRARVRMGEPSSLKEPNSLLTSEENTLKEAVIQTSGAISKSSNCDDPIERDSFMINTASGTSPLRGSSQFCGSNPQSWKAKKDQSFGCSVDGEAALPPSKRLHRALEAMSAHAAEEGQSCKDVSSDVNTVPNECSNSLMSASPHMTIETKTASDMVLQNVDPTGCNPQGVNASEPATSFNPRSGENTESSVEADLLNCRVESANIQCDKSGEENFADSGKRADGNNPCDGSDGGETVAIAFQTQSPRCSLSSPNRKESDAGVVQGSEDELLLPEGKGNTKSIELFSDRSEKSQNEFNTCERTVINMDPVSVTHDDIVGLSPQSRIDVIQLNTKCTGYENTSSSEPLPDDNKEENDMSEVVMEVVNEQKQDSSSLSIPNDHLGDGLDNHSSPSLTDGGDSLAQASPSNVSFHHVSTSDDRSLQNNGTCSPDVHLHHKITLHPPVVDGEEKYDSMVIQRPKSAGKYAESNAALTSFEAMLGTLTRTKESIGRATRVAIDCAKLGVSSKVVDVLARCLESEASLHRRVDLFFLVDSIAQCSRCMKGDIGGLYPSAFQAMLPRLLAAAAPPGNSAHENRRQCLKVLRLWLERKILPESVVRRHMRELDSHAAVSSGGAFCRRTMRTERSLDDPLREMEGMLVDEYGSNSSFQLPGFCMPSMLKDEGEGSDSDGGSFEAVTPEHSPETHGDHDTAPAIGKHRHILEDVDGELEMEDVAPCETEITSSSGAIGAAATQISQNQFEQNFSVTFAPPLPQDVPPSSPPLPSSPPPPPPPPPAIPPPCVVSDPFANGMDSKLYADPNNMQDPKVQSVGQQSNAPRINQTISDAVHYHASECRDPQRQMPESFHGPNYHNKGYPLRPPHPPPSNQFSYVRGEHHFKPRREDAPRPSYSNGHHFVQNWDRENFYNNHERIKQAPHEFHDSWRFPPHSFSGPRYPGKGKSYGPAPFVGPPSEHTRVHNQGWRFPPRSMSHRNSMPYRPPPLEGPIPVADLNFMFSVYREIHLVNIVRSVMESDVAAFVLAICQHYVTG